MSSIGKVHLNGSTVLSLNDRFTIMQKQQNLVPPRARSRSRSRSRPRMVPNIAPAASVAPRVSLRNRNLLAQLDQKHKFRLALKLKRKSMNINTRNTRNTIGAGRRRRLVRQTAFPTTATTARRRLRRSNSVAKQIATIKADLIKNVNRARRLTRTNSGLNLTEQFGARGRPRLRRNNLNARAQSRGRSASRNRSNLTRTNSKQNLNALTRSNSKARLNVRGRSASRSRQPGAPIRLKRSNIQQQSGNGMARRQRSRSRSNVRKGVSVNARLGIQRQNSRPPNRRNVNNIRNKNNNRNNNNIGQIRRGRIIKRNAPNNNVRNQIGNGLQRNGRSRSRVRQLNVNRQGGIRRSRSQNRIGGANKNNQQQKQQKQQNRRPNNPNNRRGRPQQRKPVKKEPKSKEQLDAELDQYMVNTKTSLDQEMGIYTK